MRQYIWQKGKEVEVLIYKTENSGKAKSNFAYKRTDSVVIRRRLEHCGLRSGVALTG